MSTKKIFVVPVSFWIFEIKFGALRAQKFKISGYIFFFNAKTFFLSLTTCVTMTTVTDIHSVTKIIFYIYFRLIKVKYLW